MVMSVSMPLQYSRRLNNMKTKKMKILALVLLIGLNGKTLADEFGQVTSVKSFQVKKGGTLTMDLNPGEITIVPWLKDEVSVVIHNLDREGQRNIKYKSDKTNVQVDYSSEWGGSEGISFTVNVPYVYNLDLVTKEGEVFVRGNIEGSVNIKTYAGDIDITDVAGHVSLNTNGGEIKTGNISGDVAINTLGGDVRTGKTTGKTVKLSTMGGDILMGNSTARVEAKTMGGDITVENLGDGSDLVTYGGTITAGKAKGSIKLDTYGGDIFLTGAEGNVNARTMGGDISLKNVKGSITAKTYAGDVFAELNPWENTSSEISTNSGSVELHIPLSANTKIYAKARVKRGYSESEEESKPIESAFEAKRYNEKSNYTEAEYIVNKPLSSINLYSSDSGIKINKSFK